jgi:protocatechuate 3,4-dioxygenase beta subunit
MERLITRRQALHAAGSAGAAFLVTRSGLPSALERLGATPVAEAASVVVTPTMTEGPYWIDEVLRRFDVRANTASATSAAGTVQSGVSLTLKINILDASSGAAVNGAHVDIWHANANGLYSDEASQQTGPGSTTGNTKGQNFLRGYQVTGEDAGAGTTPVDGQVSFLTIWPGWYGGRAIHIHVRVRTYDSTGTAVTNYTTQIFFSDADNSTVLAGAAPYDTRSPIQDSTTDQNDMVLTSAAAARTNIAAAAGSVSVGYASTFTIRLDKSLYGGTSSTTAAGAVADTSVAATLGSASFTQAGNGSRTLVLALHAGEALTARAKLVRGTHVLGHATGQLVAGSRLLRVAIPAAVAAGAATVKLTLADAAGNSRVLEKSVHVPA